MGWSVFILPALDLAWCSQDARFLGAYMTDDHGLELSLVFQNHTGTSLEITKSSYIYKKLTGLPDWERAVDGGEKLPVIRFTFGIPEKYHDDFIALHDGNFGAVSEELTARRGTWQDHILRNMQTPAGNRTIWDFNRQANN